MTCPPNPRAIHAAVRAPGRRPDRPPLERGSRDAQPALRPPVLGQKARSLQAGRRSRQSPLPPWLRPGRRQRIRAGRAAPAARPEDHHRGADVDQGDVVVARKNRGEASVGRERLGVARPPRRPAGQSFVSPTRSSVATSPLGLTTRRRLSSGEKTNPAAPPKSTLRSRSVAPVAELNTRTSLDCPVAAMSEPSSAEHDLENCCRGVAFRGCCPSRRRPAGPRR